MRCAPSICPSICPRVSRLSLRAVSSLASSLHLPSSKTATTLTPCSRLPTLALPPFFVSSSPALVARAAALCSLLESDAALSSFRQETGWYDALVQALPPLVHESSIALEQPDLLFDALSLCCAVVSHPIFVHTPGDSWLWERILEKASSAVEFEPEAGLQWACLAAHAAEKHDVAMLMLGNAPIKLALVHLAEPGSLDMKDMWPIARLAEAANAASVTGNPFNGGGGGSGGGGEGDGGSSTADGVVSAGMGRGGGGGLAASVASAAAAGDDWWRQASAEELEVAYARLALHRLAKVAEGMQQRQEAAGAEEPSEEEVEAAHDAFTTVYVDHVPPPLPARPPPSAVEDRLRFEEIANGIAATIYCSVGGLLWGCAAGALASARARRPVWKSAFVTCAGAASFEALMRLKLAGFERMRRGARGHAGAGASGEGGGSGGGRGGLGGDHGSFGSYGDDSLDGSRRLVLDVYGPPRHETLRGFALMSSVDVAMSSAVLLAIIQPSRAPLAFGGWVLGRLVMLSQEIEMLFGIEDGEIL